jgi:hypothetical protein
LVLVAVILALGLDRKEDAVIAAPPSSVPPTPSSEPLPDDPPEAAEKMLIMITAQPPHAEVRLDDERQGANPLVRRVPADGSTHAVVVTASGHEPQTRRLTFDREQEVVVRLTPLPETSSKPKPPGPRPPVFPGPRPTGNTRPEPPDSKPTRPLDETNPFGDGG